MKLNAIKDYGTTADAKTFASAIEAKHSAAIEMQAVQSFSAQKSLFLGTGSNA
jgi:hypothetical protein